MAWPQGPPEGAGVTRGALARELDALLTAGVEAQMAAMARHIGSLVLIVAGISDLFDPTAPVFEG